MKKRVDFKNLFKKSQILKFARHRLATFGPTEIQYYLVTDVAGLSDRARLREGIVKAEKPQIITAENIKNRFRGFGPEADQYSDWLASKYGDSLRGLQYQFKNQPTSSRIELGSPDQLANEMSKEFSKTSETRRALIQGVDQYWELSVMKFILEETLTSFESNVQELSDRGFFDGDRQAENRKHREIRHLLQKAKGNSELVKILGQKLNDYGFFEQYQDDFFQLIR